MTGEQNTTKEGQDEAPKESEEETYKLEPARVYLAGINIPKEPDEEPLND